jgi:hypothetical protein
MKNRSRLLTVVLVIGVVAMSAGAIYAATGGLPSIGSSSQKQYCPPNSPGGSSSTPPCGNPPQNGHGHGGPHDRAAVVTAAKARATRRRMPKGAKAQCHALNKLRGKRAHGKRLTTADRTFAGRLSANLKKHGYVCGRRHGKDVLRHVSHGKIRHG